MRIRAKNQSPSGFTTVELLVAIGIIVVLAGIAVWGLGGAGSPGKARATRLTMENYRNMIQELKGTKRQPGKIWVGGNLEDTAPGANPPIDFWDGVVDVPRVQGGNMQLGENRFESDAVLNTQILVTMLRSVPENRNAMQNLPADQLLKTPQNATLTKIKFRTDGSTTTIDPPLLLDAWDNPIIFVPKGGLNKITLKATGSRPTRITSAGVLNEYTGGPVNVPVSAQPFFASAGPDGSFLTADDNVYSFEN